MVAQVVRNKAGSTHVPFAPTRKDQIHVVIAKSDHSLPDVGSIVHRAERNANISVDGEYNNATLPEGFP